MNTRKENLLAKCSEAEVVLVILTIASTCKEQGNRATFQFLSAAEPFQCEEGVCVSVSVCVWEGDVFIYRAKPLSSNQYFKNVHCGAAILFIISVRLVTIDL